MRLRSRWIESRALSMLGAAGLGALAAYFLDPNSGRRRRHLAQDKMRHWAITGRDFARESVVDAGHRAKGLAARAQTAVRRDEVSNEVLVERVRSAMGRVVSHPSAIEVSAYEGIVSLFGDVLDEEAEPLIRRIESVRGVREIDDQLMRHASSADLPAVQGEPRGRQLFPEAWPLRLRLGAGAIAATAAVVGGVSGGIVGTLLLGSGLLVFVRAATDLPLRRVLEIGAKRRAIDVLEHINIDRPVEEVFTFFRNFENFPRFMSHLKSVTVTGDRSHWELEGPAHLALTWDSELLDVEPNHTIAWRSLPGSTIRSEGVVRFEEDGPDRTRIEIRMSYSPPGGAIGHAVAELFGAGAKKLMKDDLIRVKSLLEEGRATAHEGRS